jgi:superfamily II DNA or RNA helicase
MVGLRNHQWSPRYRSDRNDVVGEFYLPAYESATLYCRASGFFTSTSLTLMARGIESFTSRGGQVRLIASPRLDLDDIADIDRGYEIREVFARAAMRSLEAETDPVLLKGLGITGRLIAEGHLDIQLAFVESPKGFGIYHEKIGYFRDEFGDVVAFTGSSNETYGGLVANFESVEVYRSWRAGDDERTIGIVDDFNNLWSDKTDRLHILPFPEVAREKLVQLAQSHQGESFPARDDALQLAAASTDSAGTLKPPTSFQPREYQHEAVRAWLTQHGCGILKMATGTGKTKTALLAASHVAKVHAASEQPLVLVVVAPYQHLVDQWMQDVREFGIEPIPVYESSAKWIPQVENALASVRFGTTPCVVLVATNASFSMESFQGILNRVTAPLMLIGDEVHNLGSERLAASLPDNAIYRLGLSATPERYMDDAGTQRLFDYFGPIAFEIDLEAAIKIGALCRYEYYPRLVELDEDEMALYTELTGQIVALMGSISSLDDADPDSPLGLLLRKRANVLGHASGKLAMLADDVKKNRTNWFQLAYCAEGTRPDAYGSGIQGPSQVAEALELIGVEFGLSAHTYVSDTPREERKALLRRFMKGDDLRFLIAMRCLDEGVDIPDAQIAYILASSSNPRQFIQRRGRLLRQPTSGTKTAIIYDYLAIPQARGEGDVNQVERSMVRRELERAFEFGRLSENYPATLAALRPLKERYGLMDL